MQGAPAFGRDGSSARLRLLRVRREPRKERPLRRALPVLLDLLLAAGLLRLTQDGTWRAPSTAALVVVVRKLVAEYGLRPAERPSRAS